MAKEKKYVGLSNSGEIGLRRMQRWYVCQEIAKHLFNSNTPDDEVVLLLQQSATGMWEKKEIKL